MDLPTLSLFWVETARVRYLLRCLAYFSIQGHEGVSFSAYKEKINYMIGSKTHIHSSDTDRGLQRPWPGLARNVAGQANPRFTGL